jgi:hypothetical protein
VREGGTSDEFFRKPLLTQGWVSRGTAVLPPQMSLDMGNEIKKQPAAKSLICSGGVEGLEAEVRPQGGLTVGPKGKGWAFVRSEASIFYYSGHGAFWDGSLIEPSHEHFVTPEDLLAYWHKNTRHRKGPMNLDCLIIAGCSVLYIDFNNAGNPYNQGRKWVKLLCTNIDGGSLRVLLGYGAGKEPSPSPRGGKAPKDFDDLEKNPGKRAQWGNLIAADMARAIAGGLPDREWGKKWIEVNRKHNIYTAIAIDVWDGYRDALHPDRTYKI